MSAAALREQRMRQHYQRLYNARPSAEIARTRSAAAAAATTQRPQVSRGTPSSSRAGSAATGRRPVAIGRIVGNGLDRQKSSSNLELHHGTLVTRPPSKSPGEYWTERYLSQEFQKVPFSSDEENCHNGGGGGTMKAPLPAGRLRSSLDDLSSSAPNKNMSNKIDEFFTVVQRCEMDLQEEYESRRRRLAAAKARRMTSGSGYTPRPQWARSASTASINTASMTSTNRTLTFSKPPVSNQGKSPQVSKASSKAGKVYGSSNKSASRSFIGTPTPSRTFSQMALVKQPPLVQRAKVPRRRPGSSQTYASSGMPLKATSAVAATGHAMPDTSKIGSRLKEDKTHYQPPRRRSKTKARGFVDNRQNEAADSEYEDDFEAGEDAEDEEDDDCRDMLMTRQWLDDQAQRGIARQRAMQDGKYRRGNQTNNENTSHNFHEKESSKDSAYGYSGGENSRLATREPTPDAWQIKQQLRQQQRRSRRTNQAPRSRCGGGGGNERTNSEAEAERAKSSAYVDYVNRVTTEILRKGIFTDRAVREALEVNMASCGNGATVPISKKEAEMLLGKLSKELGIASGGSKKTPPSPGTSLASATLRDVLYSTRKQERAARSNNRPGSAAVTAAASRGNVTNMNSMPHHRATNASHDRLSEQELCDILQDASLDDSTIEEAMRAMKCNGNESEPLFSKSAGSAVGPDLMESPGNLRPLFDHLNISDLNLSFSTKGETTAKEKRSQQRALLIKSFAKNHQNSTSVAEGGGRSSRPRSAAPARNSSAAATAAAPGRKPGGGYRPVSAGRQDSSSSNPDAAGAAAVAAAARFSSSARPKSSGLRKKGTGVMAATATASQMPDTPLHSSETPRSSSLYQPESDDEYNVRANKGGERGAAAVQQQQQEQEQDQEGETDEDDVGEQRRRRNSDISEDVAETDQRQSYSSESASAEEVLESDAAEEEEEEEDS